MKNCLITGINGSGASYLAEYIVDKHPSLIVHGMARWHSTTAPSNLKRIADKIVLHECDLTDLSSVIRVIKEVKPAYIFHLAAHANVQACFNNPIAVFNNNALNTLNLFEAIRILEQDPIVQFCSTSEVYGSVNPKDVPIKESHPLNPVNMYAVSKLTQEKTALSYHYCYGAKVIVTRMFTYLNPRRGDVFSSAFTRQVVEIERGQRDVLYHGNLDSVRTLIDVRDAAESYWVASQKCKYGTPYNIGGDITMSVGEFLEILKSKAKVPIKTAPHPNLHRPADVSLQIPDNTEFHAATGWKPKISIDDSISFLLEYFRNA